MAYRPPWNIRMRQWYAAACDRLRLVPPGRAFGGHGGVVLNYHYFTADSPRTYLEVRLSALRAQLRALRDRFALAPLSELLKGCGPDDQRAALHASKRVFLTVDDADSSFLDALPLFQEVGAPVTLFAPVGLCCGMDSVDGLRSWALRYWQDLAPEAAASEASAEVFFRRVMEMDRTDLLRTCERLRAATRRHEMITTRKLLSYEQLSGVSTTPGVTLAAHSMSHARLAELPPEWLEWEVERSLTLVAEARGMRHFFAYPYGALGTFSAASNACLAEHGVRHAFSTLALTVPAKQAPFLLGRASALDGNSATIVCGTAAGAFQWLDRLRYRKRLLREHV